MQDDRLDYPELFPELNRSFDMVCAQCGAHFPMPGLIFECIIVHDERGHEVKYRYP